MSENAACAHLRVMYRTETDGQGFTRGWWECEDCPAHFVPESSLAKAQADVEALRRYYVAAEAYIPVAEYGGGVLQDMGADIVHAIMDEYYAAEVAIPEHLRGASR